MDKNKLSKFLRRPDVVDISRLYSDLNTIHRYLTQAERGELLTEYGDELMRCAEVQRQHNDPGFGFARFTICGDSVMVGFSISKTKSSILHISEVVIGYSEPTVILEKKLQVLNCAFANWRPRNHAYWINMILVAEAKLLK